MSLKISSTSYSRRHCGVLLPARGHNHAICRKPYRRLTGSCACVRRLPVLYDIAVLCTRRVRDVEIMVSRVINTLSNVSVCCRCRTELPSFGAKVPETCSLHDICSANDAIKHVIQDLARAAVHSFHSSTLRCLRSLQHLLTTANLTTQHATTPNRHHRHLRPHQCNSHTRHSLSVYIRHSPGGTSGPNRQPEAADRTAAMSSVCIFAE